MDVCLLRDAEAMKTLKELLVSGFLGCGEVFVVLVNS